MGTAAVIPMGSANHSERPVPKSPPLDSTGAVSFASSSRGAEAWNAIALGATALWFERDMRDGQCVRMNECNVVVCWFDVCIER